MTADKKAEQKPNVKDSETPPKKLETTDKQKQIPDRSETKSRSHNEPVRASEQSKKHEQKTEFKRENKPPRIEVKSPEVSEEHKAKANDLKSALAALSGQSSNQHKNKIQQAEVKPEETQQANKEKGRERKQNRHREEGNNVSRHNEVVRNNQSQIKAPDHAEVQQTPVADKSAFEVKQSPHSQIGGARQPAFTYTEAEAQPDLATVKQMLRTSGKDRPPGLS